MFIDKINPMLFTSKILCILIILLLHGSVWAKGNNSSHQLQEMYASVVEKAMPAVVTVYSLKQVGNRYTENGVGSGFFVSRQGHVVTNFHVIAQADALALKLSDGTVLNAHVAGTSQDTDLAVLKAEGKSTYKYLKFADTRKVKAGHYAIAIGAPFSLSQTVTTGIVSHKGRALGKHYQEDYIQTDASINPGNSGGPLLNIDGEVIGVNDCILSPGNRRSPGSVGIGFAIDGNLAARVVKKIMLSPQKTVPFAGMTFEGTTTITRILPKSPAERAGLKAGDTILQIDNKPVNSLVELQRLIISFYNPGDSANLIVHRQGKRLKTTIKFAVPRK